MDFLSVENNKESSITSWKTHDPNSIIILKDPTSVAMESEVISPNPLLMNRQLNQPHLEGGRKGQIKWTIYIQKKLELL